MISVTNLSKNFIGNNGETISAVKNINFQVDSGQVLAIIGTSGCGKTTTLKMLNRLVEPSDGEIKINGKSSLSADPIEWRRGIGYVVQKAGLLPHLTIEDNISLLSKILKKEKSLIKNRIVELLELVTLPYDRYSKMYPKELSGGQQQRVGIARALMEDPPVLLMDEPFGALDPITRSSLQEEFLQLNQKMKKTIIIVTHDLEEAFKMADAVMIMNKGEILQIGHRDEFINNPASAFVEDFVSGHL